MLSVLLSLMFTSAATAQDVTTGDANGTPAGNEAGQANVTVDWDNVPELVGGSWAAGTMANMEADLGGPAQLNIFTNEGGQTSLGSIHLLTGNAAHAVYLPAAATAQRREDATAATITLDGGTAWLFDVLDEGEADEQSLVGYGVLVQGTVNAFGGTGTNPALTFNVTNPGQGEATFLLLENGAVVTGTVTDAQDTSNILGMMAETDGAAAASVLLTGDVNMAGADDMVVVEAESETGGTGNAMAGLTGNVNLGTSGSDGDTFEISASSYDTGTSTAILDGNLAFGGVGEVDVWVEGSAANATATITGTITFAGEAEMEMDILSNDTEGLASFEDAIDFGDADSTLAVTANPLGGSGFARASFQGNVDLGNGTNVVTLDGSNAALSQIYFNGAADGSGANTTILGGTGNDTINIREIGGGFKGDIDLATTAGGDDLILIDDTNVAGNISMGAGTSNTLRINDDPDLTGNVTLDGNTQLVFQTTASSLDITGTIDLADGVGLTLANPSNLTVSGGITNSAAGGAGVRISAGTFDESAINIEDGTVGVEIASGATLTLEAAADQTLSALAGAGTLNANGNNLIISGAGTNFTGTISNLSDLTFTGDAATFGGGYSFGDNAANDALVINSATADVTFGGGNTITGNLVVTNGAFDLGASNDIAGGVSLAAGTLTTAGGDTIGGGLSVSGGTATMAGSNTISGDIDVTGGTLSMTGSNSFGETTSDADAITINNAGATVTLGGANTVTGNVVLTNGTLNLTGAQSVTGGLTVSAGTATSSAASTFSGDITVDGGALTLSGDTTFGDNDADNAMTIAGGATATLSGSHTIAGKISIAGTGKMLATTAGIQSAESIVIDNGSILGAATSAGLSIDAATQLNHSAIDATGEGFVVDAAAGRTTISNYTAPALAGDGETIALTGTSTNYNIVLADFTSADDAFDEDFLIGSNATVRLTGTIDLYDTDEVKTSHASGKIILDGTVVDNDGGGAQVVAGAAGVLLYGPNAVIPNYNLDDQTGLATPESGTSSIASPVSIGGDVSFAGGAGLELTGDVDLGSAPRSLEVDGATTEVTIKGSIANPGALTKSGAGTLVLDTELPEAATVSAGKLTLGSNANVTGKVTVNGGTLSLAKDALAGGLDVNGGTIEATTSLDIDDAVTDTGGGVNIGGTQPIRITGQYTAAGNLTTGTGATLTLENVTGALTKAGDGILIINENGTDNTVDIDAGTLMGVGPIGGAATIASGATHAPGTSVGAPVTVGGNYTLDGTLEIEIDTNDANVNDKVLADGSITLGADSAICVTAVSGTVNTGDTFTILESDADSAGGETITDNRNDTDIAVASTVRYTFTGALANGNTDFVLTATSRPFTALATTSNNLAIATALDAMGSNDLTDALGALSEAQFDEAVRQLNAETHIAAVAAAVPVIESANGQIAGRLASLRQGNAALARADATPVGLAFASAASDPALLAQALVATDAPSVVESAWVDERQRRLEADWSLFAKAYGVFSDQDTTSQRTGYTANTGGFVAGLDRPVADNCFLGLMFGYAYTDLDYDRSRGTGEIHSLRVGPYAGYDAGPLFVDASLTFGYHFNDSERDVTVGSFQRTAEADYNAWDLALYAGMGYEIQWDALTLTPFGSLQYVYYDQEAFDESGGGAANLSVSSWDDSSLRSTLGLRAALIDPDRPTTLVPEAYVGWAHEFLGDDEVNARFVGQSTPFAFDPPDDNDDSVIFGAGLTAMINANTSAYVRYDGQVQEDGDIHAVTLGVNVSF
jgi:outer membrane autotransporter protein